jgi:23S rRNA pseudouridine1911/1915/1917 synthase
MNTQETIDTIFVNREDINFRLDKLLSVKFPNYSRTYFQSLVEKEQVLVNGLSCKKREKLLEGDEIEICFVLAPEISLEPENIPLEILFEDDDLLIINKPYSMVVHPAPGHPKHTFVNALLYYCRQLPIDPLAPLRPGIVHRLDKDTSGVLIAAKTSNAHRALVKMFSERKIKKIYKTLCVNKPLINEINAPLKRHPTKRQEMTVSPDGKEAITELELLAHNQNISLLKIELITGRTHQIRAHFKHIGCPILGDPIYGVCSLNQKWGITRQMLHAESVEFIHPITNEKIEVHAPLPDDMAKQIHLFFSSK